VRSSPTEKWALDFDLFPVQPINDGMYFDVPESPAWASSSTRSAPKSYRSASMPITPCTVTMAH
jgi:hypothetical protein